VLIATFYDAEPLFIAGLLDLEILVDPLSLTQVGKRREGKQQNVHLPDLQRKIGSGLRSSDWFI